MSSGGQRIYPLEKRSLFGLSLLFSFCIIFVVALIVGYNSYTRAKDAAIGLNGTRATLLAKLILENQRAAIGVLGSYSRRPLLIDAVKRKDFEGALNHLADLAKSNPEVEWPYIANPDSTVWVNFPVDKGVFNKDLSDRDWYKGVSKEWKPYISSVYKMVVGEKDLAVTVSVPVFDEKGKVIGILNAAQGAALFRKIIDDVSLNSDVYMTLIDQAGHIICSNRFPYTKEVIDYPPLDFLGRAKKGERGDVEIQGPSDGNSGRYVSFAPIEGVGWSVIVEKGKSEMLRSEYSSFALIAAISFLIFVVVALSLVYLRARQRQIKRLEKLNEELDERVRERTAELEVKNQSLNGEITERKKVEGSLRESEERWATTLASIGDAVIATDTAGRITFMNAVAEELTGWTLREAIQQPVPGVFHIINEYTRQEVDDPVSKVLKEGVIVGLANHTVLLRKDGNEVPIDDSGAPISGKDGKVLGVVLIFRDITERKQAEEALSQSNERLNLALSSAKMGAFDWDIVKNKRFWDDNVHRLLGTKPETFTGTAEEFFAIIHPEDRSKVQADLAKAIETTIYETEYRAIWPDDSIHHITARGKVHRDNAGQAVRMTAICWDITERKRAEAALREGEERLRFALETSHTGAWDLDLVDHTAYRSLDHDRIFGYAQLLPQWTYEMFLDHVLPEDRGAVDAKFRQAVESQGDWSFECRIRRSDGEIRWIWAAGRHRADMAGRARRMAGIVQDITERKQAEKKLNDSERLYRAIGESIDYGIWVCDPDGRNTYASESFLKLVGLTQDRCSEFGWGDVLHPEDAERTIAAWKECVRTGGKWDIEHRFRGADGQWHPILARGVPVRDEQGKLVCWAGINLDISALKQMEEDLRRSRDELETRVQERTEELERSHQRLQQLAAQLLQAQEKERKRVAVELHDSLLSELAAMKFVFEAKLMLLKKGQLADANEFDRVTDIMQKLMKDARGIMNNLRPSILDEMGLIPTIDWLSREYQKAYGHIQIRRQMEVLEKDIPEVLKIAIFRVLQEALNNFARHGRGDLVDLSLWKSGNTLHLKIQDNGEGFDVGKVQKGVGLESMRERVELSGGEFQIESMIGQGTTIRAIWSCS